MWSTATRRTRASLSTTRASNRAYAHCALRPRLCRHAGAFPAAGHACLSDRRQKRRHVVGCPLLRDGWVSGFSRRSCRDGPVLAMRAGRDAVDTLSPLPQPFAPVFLSRKRNSRMSEGVRRRVADMRLTGHVKLVVVVRRSLRASAKTLTTLWCRARRCSRLSTLPASDTSAYRVGLAFASRACARSVSFRSYGRVHARPAQRPRRCRHSCAEIAAVRAVSILRALVASPRSRGSIVALRSFIGPVVSGASSGPRARTVRWPSPRRRGARLGARGAGPLSGRRGVWRRGPSDGATRHSARRTCAGGRRRARGGWRPRASETGVCMVPASARAGLNR